MEVMEKEEKKREKGGKKGGTQENSTPREFPNPSPQGSRYLGKRYDPNYRASKGKGRSGEKEDTNYFCDEKEGIEKIHPRERKETKREEKKSYTRLSKISD